MWKRRNEEVSRCIKRAIKWLETQRVPKSGEIRFAKELQRLKKALSSSDQKIRKDDLLNTMGYIAELLSDCR